ncbi:MAG TPA: MBL fold metallo-hydrolase [Telluria sp.]|nr:MBL fold metallo-hydrolase [Telluria sp.]
MRSRLPRFATIILFATALAGLCYGLLRPAASANVADDSQRPELAYLKQVNAWRVPSDPQLVFLLMAQFANAGRQGEGIEYFKQLRARFAKDPNAASQVWYLMAEAALRAGHAGDINLLSRVGYVREAVQMLDQAKRLAGSEAFMPRWMSGVVRAQLPRLLGEGDTALADLQWCEKHLELAPHAGWMREVYFNLASLYRARGDGALADRYLAKSGLSADTAPVVFTHNFTEGLSSGHAFTTPKVSEIVPKTVYLASGFEFTEYYFVVSEDRKELIAIDMGTRAESARAAYDALHAAFPQLPPLTTVFITHAHFDHVGGQAYFRSLRPQPTFYGRANYAEELEHDATSDPAMLRLFFGTGFKMEDVLSYHPDVPIDRATDVVVGGTRFQLLPTRGGETNDALLIHMPGLRLTFVGDVMMPYLGAPFLNEGSPEGMLAAIEQIHALQPQRLMHGHEPLTRVFPTPAILDEMHDQLVWLRAAVLREMQAGTERGGIHALNLVPPQMEKSDSAVQLAYLVLRDNFIDRLFQQNSGYWQNGLHGLDALTSADRGEVLTNYLGVSESQLASAVEQMIADGKHELAAETLRSCEKAFPGSERLARLHKLAYLKLMEKYQEFNPFKFIVYAGESAKATSQEKRGK